MLSVMAGQEGGEKAGCGPRRHNGKKGQGVRAEEAKIDALKMQLLRAQQSLPRQTWVPALEDCPEEEAWRQ